MKAIFGSFILLLSLAAVSFYRKNDFALQIRSSVERCEKWDTDLSHPHLDEILTQKFTYLGRGTQSYVFLSQDEKYVIKFIKMNHVTPNKWLQLFPLPFLKKQIENKVDKRVKKLHQMFDALQWAYRDFKDESGLLFIHLNRTKNWNKKITLTDKQGKIRTLSLDNVPFIIQEKAELIYHRLFRLIEAKQFEEAKSSLRSMLHLVSARGNKGFIDEDRSISNNFGFVGDKPIQLDLGRLIPSKDLAASQEVQRIGNRICAKISDHYPEHAPLFLDILHEFEPLIQGAGG